MRRTLAGTAAAVVGMLAAAGGPAAADPGCELNDPRPICTGDPVPTEKPPVAVLESQDLVAGGSGEARTRIWRAKGYMYDPNGGPVWYKVWVDGVVETSGYANQYHAARGKYDAFDLTVGVPATPGNHTIRIQYFNVADGTDPNAPPLYALAPYTYQVKPLPLIVETAAFPSPGTFTFTVIDQSNHETGFRVGLAYTETFSYPKHTWVDRTVSLDLPPHPGTGRFTLTVPLERNAGVELTSYHIVSLRTKEGGVLSDAATTFWYYWDSVPVHTPAPSAP
ncbi:hypothetical protein [Micromonospora aurantiaca (nom. illeg.)]|uniref:hypothetical protein n=1 Tax=Micromonospora aurantiaca (nom. illeg.) TaxID=47850 RepID=UPI0033F31472